MTIDELKEAYRVKECTGIAAFIEFLKELDQDEREEVFIALVQPVRDISDHRSRDPILFLSTMYALHKHDTPFVSEGIKQIDLICGQVALLWQESEHAKQ